jgi:ABC-type bacteriocin/lantibiotic exporter with double-glycine peptidase domain
MSSHSRKKTKYKAKKRKRFLNDLRRYLHNILTISIYLGLLVFVYILFFSLLIDPLIISKSYGTSNTPKFIYLAMSGILVGASYLIRLWVNYTEEQQWERNLRLLKDVKFNLDRYASLKRMGIDHINKHSRKRRTSSSHKKTQT